MYCFGKQKCVPRGCGDKKDYNSTTCKPDEVGLAPCYPYSSNYALHLNGSILRSVKSEKVTATKFHKDMLNHQYSGQREYSLHLNSERPLKVINVTCNILGFLTNR